MMAVLEGGGPVGASISAAKSAKFSAQVAAGRFKEVGLVPSFFFPLFFSFSVRLWRCNGSQPLDGIDVFNSGSCRSL